MNNNPLGSRTAAADVYMSAGNGNLDWVRIQNAFVGQGGWMLTAKGTRAAKATYAVGLSAVPSTAHISLTGLQTQGHGAGQFRMPAVTTNIVSIGNQGN